jgi:hypothetical protein
MSGSRSNYERTILCTNKRKQHVVTNVHVVTAEFMAANPERYPGTWVETFFDTEGKTYAGVGYIYDYDTQDFTPPPQPEPIDEP